MVGFDFGFVALDVDEDFIRQATVEPGGGLLGDAVGAAFVIDVGHDAAGAEGVEGIDDSLVVRGDDDLAHFFAPAHLVDDVLHEGPAGVGGENLGGETGRAESRGE